MERVEVTATDSDRFTEGGTRRSLTTPLEATNVAINTYRLAPGAALPGGLHAHMDQEEIFVVLAGDATFETLRGDITVGQEEAVRFAPGEFHSGKNDGDEPLNIIAIGAPQDTTDVRIPVDCPACGFDNLRVDSADGQLTFTCSRCEAEHLPRDCPACGSDELLVTTDETTEPIVRCQQCGAEFERPPMATDGP